MKNLEPGKSKKLAEACMKAYGFRILESSVDCITAEKDSVLTFTAVNPETRNSHDYDDIKLSRRSFILLQNTAYRYLKEHGSAGRMPLLSFDAVFVKTDGRKYAAVCYMPRIC